MSSHSPPPHSNSTDAADERSSLDFPTPASPGDQGDEGDVYQCLAQKERDLILAAELGKALLDSNQELQSQYDQTVEEYTLKVEELQQEKHGLHLELEKMEREYQNAIKDLQDDIASLQKQIRDGTEQQVVEKESSRFLREAQRNIDYLMEQIKKASVKEEELLKELDEEKRKSKSSSATMQDQMDHIAMLREQVEYLSEKLRETNEKLEEVQNERDSLWRALEKAQEMLQVSEAKISQQKDKLNHQESELEELQESNCELQQQINHLQSSQHHKQQYFFRTAASQRQQQLHRYNTHDGSTAVRGSKDGQAQSLLRELSSHSSGRKDQKSRIPKISQKTDRKDKPPVLQKKPKSLSLDMPQKPISQTPKCEDISDICEENQPQSALFQEPDIIETIPPNESILHKTQSSDNSVTSEDSHEQFQPLPNSGVPAEQSLFAELCSSLSEEQAKSSQPGSLKPTHRRNASDCSLSSLTEGSRKRQHDNIKTDSDESDEDSPDRSGCKQTLYSHNRNHQRRSLNCSLDDTSSSDMQPQSQWDSSCLAALPTTDKVPDCVHDDDLTDFSTSSLYPSACEELDPMPLQQISNVKIGSPCQQQDANKELSSAPRLRDLSLFTELSPVSELPPLQQGDPQEQSLFSELSSQLGEEKSASGSEASPGCAMGVFDFSTGYNSQPQDGEMHSPEPDPVSDMPDSGARPDLEMQLNSGEWNQMTSLTCDMLEEDDFECDDDDFLVGNMEGTTLSIGGGGHSLMYYSPNVYLDSGCNTTIESGFFTFDKEDEASETPQIDCETDTPQKASCQDGQEHEKINEACKQLRELVGKAHAGGLISAPDADSKESSTDTLLALIGQLKLCVESACADKQKQLKDVQEDPS